jgi:NADP-dependent 3-hydroxy acid dehydrogenase YdfG/aryl carrier-like protein
MRFGTLDISKDPSAQGYPPGSFDLVLGFNVVHATPRVEATLGHLKDLLTPGGLLVMVEPIRRQRWVDLVWGLTEGWWSFEDTDIRTLSPLLGLSQWEKEVERLGFQQITVYPSDNAARVQADTGLIVAEKPRDAAQNEAGNPPAAATPLDELSIQSRIQRVRKLEDMGAEVMVFDADVADRARMQEVIGRARARFGTIDGAIHAALILDDGAIQLKAAESARRVMSPKVHGTLVLADLLRESDLDFFVMFSSLVGVLGGSGQVDYCAASNFQDAFAQACNPGLARSVISIDWGLWREVGKALRSAVEHGSTAKDALPEGMSTAEGLDAFARVMSHDQTQVLISTQPLEALLSRAGRAGWRPSEEHLVAPSVAQSRSETHGAYVAPRNEVESAIAEIWSTVLGIARIGVHDNFFDLGVDSVVSLQFIARAKALGLNFTNKQVFQHQTIAELATVADIDGGAQPQSELPATAGAGSACDDVQPPSPARFPGARISERDLDRVLGRIGAAGEDKLE